MWVTPVCITLCCVWLYRVFRHNQNNLTKQSRETSFCWLGRPSVVWKFRIFRPHSLRFFLINALTQGSPTPRPQTASGPQPVRKVAAPPEVSGGQAKLHLPLCIARITAWTMACSIAWTISRPPSDPHPCKNCLPRNRSLVPESLGTATTFT